MTATGRADDPARAPTRTRRTPRYLMRQDVSTRDANRHIHDVAALNRFEAFLFSAVACVLITRTFLAVTGYPQVGGSSGLHLAHVLWGGLFLGIGIVMTLVGLGSRVRLRAAIIGGVGFGLFIDEVGKFVTKNTNYFYEPAVAIMYATFVAFYVVVREVVYRRELNERRRLALAATALADQTLGELDEAHRAVALQLIEDVPGETSECIRRGLLSQPTSGSRFEHYLTRVRNRLTTWGTRVYGRRWVQRVIITLIVLEIVTTFLTALADATGNGDPGNSKPAEVGALLSSIVTATIMGYGLILLMRGRRVAGLHALQLGIMIDLLVTFVFQFASAQFAALVSLAIQLFIFQGVRFALRVESVRQAQPARGDQR
jgi:hypothetical protein